MSSQIHREHVPSAAKGKFKISPNAIRAHFLLRNTTLYQWAMARGFAPSSIFAAVRGLRMGPRSKKLLTALEKEMGTKIL
jgi:hypothetical protein